MLIKHLLLAASYYQVPVLSKGVKQEGKEGITRKKVLKALLREKPLLQISHVELDGPTNLCDKSKIED